MLLLQQVDDQLLVVGDLVDVRVERGNTYSAPCGLTQSTPGISFSVCQAWSRWSRSLPPGCSSAVMLCGQPSAAWMAYWLGTLGHIRMLASSSRLEVAGRLRRGPLTSSQPVRKPGAR